MTERGKLGGTGVEDAIPTFLPRRKSPEGAPPSKDTGASGHPPSASSPTSEDSAVDSDDSIELEIRRFLAEKAKESVRNAEPQAVPAKPEMPCRKEPTPGLQPGVCTRSQKARGTPQLAEGRRGPERARTQATSLLSQTGRGTLRAEQATHLTSALGRSEPALPKNTSKNSSAKASPPSRKSANVHKDHSPQGIQTAMAESVFGQLPSCATVGTEAGSTRGTFHLNCGSQNLLTPNPGSQTHPASPQAPGRACLSFPRSSSTLGRMFPGEASRLASSAPIWAYLCRVQLSQPSGRPSLATTLYLEAHTC